MRLQERLFRAKVDLDLLQARNELNELHHHKTSVIQNQWQEILIGTFSNPRILTDGLLFQRDDIIYDEERSVIIKHWWTAIQSHVEDIVRRPMCSALLLIKENG